MEQNKKRTDALLMKCRSILKEEGIPAAENIEGPIINSRVRSWFGRCRKTESGFVIEISSRLLDSSDKEIETVLIHELLHTCPGCMNHGRIWKKYAAYLNGKYGYMITGKTSYEKMGIENPGSRESVKYLVVCTKCGQEIPRRRMCPLVQHTEAYRCGKCGGKFEIR